MGFDENVCRFKGKVFKAPEQVGQNKICTFQIATRHYLGKDDQGKARYEQEYVTAKCFGFAYDEAMNIQENDRVAVKGRLHTESWDADGGKKYRTFCYVDSVDILLQVEKQQ